MRQAVVLIHGIGEPRPMSTLRGFVEALLTGERGKGRILRSKPDRLSESYELRRLVANGTRTRPTTDFYEFYWAHHMEGNTVRHVWPLARLLLVRWPWRVPAPLALLWLVSWSLTAATLYAWMKALSDGTFSELSNTRPVLWALTTGALAGIQLLISQYLGDAARYLSPTPPNVSIRQKIRADGVDVVRRIHNSKRYDRIVIVGHSLGSVIGYDIITHLWDQCNTAHDKPERPKQAKLKALEALLRQPPSTRANAGDQFRELQRELWLEQRSLGNPWLITDFVTIGSPLTYGGILFARDDQELRRRQADGELPTCPPMTDDGELAYRAKTWLSNGQPRTLRVLHHAAPFAVTRWTNLYVPLKAGLLGDWVGGPLRKVFGDGIADVPLLSASAQFVPLLSHVRYWRTQESAGLSELRKALSLDSKNWLPRSPRVTENSTDAAATH